MSRPSRVNGRPTMTIVSRESVVAKVSKEVVWWINNRMNKLRGERHDTMSLNPFLAPILYNLHNAGDFAELGTLLLAGHSMTGHSTGFGKLTDERLLPNVFGTQKLTGAYRSKNPPFAASYFNEIDHVVAHLSPKPILLSLKTSRWTIQLTAAMELNAAFVKIIEKHIDQFEQIVVGVSIGSAAELSDKYDILRGINRGKNHDVVDIQQHVHVLAGRSFWAWINAGEQATQDWILEGILAGLHESNCREEGHLLLASFAKAFNRSYDKFKKDDGTIDWYALLTSING